MAKIMLDRSRYFSSVHGEITDNVFFRQDGLPFDGAGNLVEKALDEAGRKTVERKLKEIAKKPADAEPEVVDPANVNLEQWLRGTVRYPYHIVQNAIRDRYHRTITNFAEAVEFLVIEQRLVPEEEIAKEHRARVA